MANVDEKLIDMIGELLSLYKVVNRKTITDVLKGELNNQQLIEIYQLTDGEHSTRELAGALKNKCSHNTIARAWNKWALMGIVIPAKQKGRYKAAFNLVEYGITMIQEDE